MFRGDGSIRFFKGVNAHKVDQSTYNVSAILKKNYLSLFDVDDDSRSNFFRRKKDDVILPTTSKDPLEVFIESILRLKT